MNVRAKWGEFATALGTGKDIRRKVLNACCTLQTTFNRKERRRRLRYLKDEGIIEEIPTEWQIFLGAYEMLFSYIIPSNGEFYEHYDKNQYWLQFLRIFDEPSAMMDPTGLAVSRDMIISHILHVVHISVGYDVGLLHMFPGGIQELTSQLQAYVKGEHPRQASIAAVLERPDYPQRLLQALRLYEEDPEKHWKIVTYDTPDGCGELLEFGLERFGTLGRLLNHALSLPRTPWASLMERLGLIPQLPA